MNKECPLCQYDELGVSACFGCPYRDCLRNDIDNDPSICDAVQEKPKAEDISQIGKRKYCRYKGTPYDDQRHQKAREYAQRKRDGLPPVPKKPCVRKGREREYQREYRARMDDYQKMCIREKQKLYQREYRKRKREEAQVNE